MIGNRRHPGRINIRTAATKNRQLFAGVSVFGCYYAKVFLLIVSAFIVAASCINLGIV